MAWRAVISPRQRCNCSENMSTSESEPDRIDLAAQLAEHRERLTKMVRFRMDKRIRGRIDPSDVVQEACLEAFRRFDKFREDKKMPFYVWLRFLTVQQLQIAQRKHLAYQVRSVAKDVPLNAAGSQSSNIGILADALSGNITSPSNALAEKELRERLVAALESLDEKDREILALRHFEQLNTIESAQVLGISEGLASTRYGRALRKLMTVMKNQSSSDSELRA